jgi:hypothetical protein
MPSASRRLMWPTSFDSIENGYFLKLTKIKRHGIVFASFFLLSGGVVPTECVLQCTKTDKLDTDKKGGDYYDSQCNWTGNVNGITVRDAETKRQ